MAEPYRGLVLVVDDDPDACGVVSTSLAGVGFKCIVATHAEEALSRAAVVRFDVVLLDLELPRREHGIALARRLRSSMPSACPVVAMTAVAAIETADRPLFAAVLGKPVDPDGVRAVVIRLTEEQR